MVHFKWIKMLLFVIQLLQFTVTEKFSSSTVRHGDDVTLPCGNVRDDQEKCDKTTWLFSGSGNTAAVELVNLGKIKTESNSKSDRLNVTENCSLVIKNVTDEDVGHYTCRQFEKPGGQQLGPDSKVDVSVVTITEHKHCDSVTLKCSVKTHGPCRYTLKWLLNKKEVDKNKMSSLSTCSVNVTNSTARLFENSTNVCYECNVTNDDTREVKLFPFRLFPFGLFPFRCQSSVEWWHITLPVVLAGLISAVVFVTWKNRKGERVDDTMELNLNAAEIPYVPETSEAQVDPQYGVSYASLSFSSNGKSKVQNKDDRGEEVTYSTVKAPSSSSSSAAAASTDPSILYATAKY
ncbi:uncharacterized protein [Channa argus]|uniref:uncharacterized protein isoform X2 n=1 Tax=Channa argus TaxID=215402 RepID=UPI0035227456